MAGGNLGSLDFALEVKSNIDKVINANRKTIEKLDGEITDLKKQLETATAAGNKLTIDSLNKQIEEANGKLKTTKQNLKDLDTRSQAILNKAHDIANIRKTLQENGKDIRLVNPSGLKEAGHELSRLIALLRQMSSVSEGSSFLTGIGFKGYKGEITRSVPDLRKESNALAKEASSSIKKSNKEIEDAQKKAEAAEDQAVKYYRTRKQHVDDAIQELSKKQANFAKLQEKSSADDVRMLKTASDQAEILKQRLLAAKSEYETMQKLKAQGVPGAALSKTFLGSETGMSELFGANFSKLAGEYYTQLFGSQFSKQDNLSYNDFTAKSKEIVDLAKQHNKELEKQEELQDRINKKTNPLQARHDDISTEIKGRKELIQLDEQREKQSQRAFEAEQRQIAKTQEQYAKLSSTFREGWQLRQNPFLPTVARNDIITRLQSMLPALRELRAAVSTEAPAFNLYNSGQSKIELNELKERIKAYTDLAEARRKEREEAERQRPVLVKNSQLDTKPIERQIEQYEKAVAIYSELQKVLSDIGAAKALGAQRNDSLLGADYGKLQEQAETLKATFESLGNGMNIDKVRQELNSLYDTLEKFTTANANAKPLISETHDDFALEKQRLAQQEKHQLRQQEIEDAFRVQDAERKSAEADAQTERRVHEELVRLQNERRQNQLDNLAKIEAKERELAELYGRLRSSRDEGLKNGADVSQIEKDLQAVRELYSEMQRLRRDVPTDKGWNPIGFSASEAAAMQRHMQGVTTEVQRIRNEAQGATNAARDLASAFDRVHNSASKSSQVLSDIKSLFLQGGIVFAAQQFANSIIQTGGDIVQQHIALRSILGDVQKADTLFAQTQQLALQSPFTFQELNRDVKQLAAYGVDTDRLYDTTKRLADVASGLGVSFERLGLAYGQVKARSWLDGKELRQFAYAGLPMLQKIADLYNEIGKNGKRNYTTSDVRNMITKRQVSFEDVDEVFKRLTDEGGQFYNMQFVLSDTLLGKWNKLQDAWSIMLGKFADGKNIIGQTFMVGINLATELVQSIDKLGPVLTAAFSGFALNKARNFIAGGLTSSLLSAKGSLATEYTRSALAGEQLSAAQTRILATKEQITAEDLKALANAKAITAVDLQRAYIMGKITSEQYRQIAPLLNIKSTSEGIARQWAHIRWTIRKYTDIKIPTIFTGSFWSNFGMRASAAIGVVAKGIGGLFKSMWAMIGGLPGFIITGLTMIGTKLWQDHEQLVQSIDDAKEVLQKKNQELQKYLDDNPLRLNVSTGDLAKQIDQEKEKLKETAGDLYDTIQMNAKGTTDNGNPNGKPVTINGISPGGDEANQLKYWREYTELLDEATDKAKKYQAWFNKIIDDADHWNTESVATNLKDLENSATGLQVVLPKLTMRQLVEDAQNIKKNTASGFNDTWKNLADYILSANKAGQDLDTTLSGINKKLTKDSDVSGDYKGGLFDYAKAEVNVLKNSSNLDDQVKEVAKSMAGQFKNLATDPMEQAIYSALKDGWKNASKMDVVQGNIFDIKLDKAMGLQDFPSLAEDIAKDAASRMSDATKQELATGQPLTESAKKDVNKAKQEAINRVRTTWPGAASEIQAILDSQRFNINVWMHIMGGDSAAQGVLDDAFLGFAGLSKLSNTAQSYYTQWTSGASNAAQAANNARTAIKGLEEDMNEANRDKKKISKSYRDEATKNYKNAVSAFYEIFGYRYEGESSGYTKKLEQQAKARQVAAEKAQRKRQQAEEKARREAERRERAYLRARQKEGEAIQKYYDTYSSWRQIEGENRAKARVSSDDRFKNISSKYTDPAKLAENYKSLAESIKKASGSYEKMSDERKQLYDDYMAKAAEQEAKIVLENAKKQIESFKEILDLLAKRYDWYERLSKVAGKDFAASFAFDTKSHSTDYYHYIKDKVLGGLKRTTYEDLGGESDGKNPAGTKVAKDKVVLDNITVSAKAFPKIDLDQIRKGATLEDALAMPYNQLVDKLGEKAATWLKKFKDERDKIDEATVASLEEGFTSLDDYGAQIDAINKKYDTQIERLKERNQLEKDNDDYISKDTLGNSTDILNRQRNKEIADINYKQFQKSDEWLRFFGASFLLSTRGADMYRKAIENGVNKAFDAGAISAEEYANKINEIHDRMNEINKRRSPVFDYLTGGFEGILNQRRNDGKAEINRAAKIRENANKLLEQANITPGQEGENMKVRAQSMLADAENIEKGGKAMLEGADNAANTIAIIDKVVHGINDNVQKLKALIDDIAQSIEIFAGKDHADNFKNSSGYAFISGFSSASQGATDAWDSLKSGNIMGVVEGGYRSIIGWAEPWARRHDAKLDKQIQLAERQNKLIDAMRSSIERRLANSLGGVYGYKAKDSDLKTIKDGLDNYSLAKKGTKYGRNTIGQSSAIGAGVGAATGLGTAVGLGAIGGAMSGLGAGVGAGAAIGSAAGPIGAAIGVVIGGIIGGLFGHHRKKHKTNYTEDTFEAMERADQTQEYYDQMFAAYKMQRDNLNAQMNAESKKKSKDKDKIQDYRTQIDELDDKIQTFAKDMAKSLYDIDIKSWANELTEAVVSAWAAGEDAVEAYKDKVKDLMKTLSTNIISQKIMQIALEPVESYIEKIMDAQSGKLNEDNIIAIANMLDSIGDTTIPSIIELLEKLKARGWDLSDTSSSSMSSSIKGMTEQTADLLASYVNAIRADVSVIRQLSSSLLPELNVTVTAQLQQLNMIAANTRKNAEAAEQISQSTEEILYIFRAVTNDTKRISVNAK